MSKARTFRTRLGVAVFAAILSFFLQPVQAESGLPEPAETPPALETEEPAEAPRFDIREYRVEGNSVLSREQIERAVYPFLGPGKTLDAVEEARKSLEQRYHDAGYKTVAVAIPEQQVVGGLVRLQVTEGRVDRVRVKGSRYYLPSRLRGELQALAPGTVVHMPTLQRQLNALNRMSGDRQVTPVFRAGQTPGTVEVDLRVKDDVPLHASLELNNRYSANTDSLRAVATARYDNLWQREHSVSLLLYQTPGEPDQVQAYSGTYLFRSDDALDLTVFYGLHSSSNLSVIGGSTVIGSGNIWGLRKIYTLPASPGFQHGLSVGADYKEFEEDIVLGSDTLSSPIRYLPFAVLYNAARADGGGTVRFSAALNFSTRTFSDRTIDCAGQALDQFSCRRVGASANYAYLKTELQRSQDLPAGLALELRADAQVAGEPLISNEQYGAGGLSSVRGYLESERLGDSGWRAGVEVHTPSWLRERKKDEALYGLLFYEAAWLRVLEPLPEQASQFELSSLGAGIRFKLWGGLKGEAHWGLALNEGAETERNESRAHARLEYGF